MCGGEHARERGRLAVGGHEVGKHGHDKNAEPEAAHPLHEGGGHGKRNQRRDDGKRTLHDNLQIFREVTKMWGWGEIFKRYVVLFSLCDVDIIRIIWFYIVHLSNVSSNETFCAYICI